MDRGECLEHWRIGGVSFRLGIRPSCKKGTHPFTHFNGNSGEKVFQLLGMAVASKELLKPPRRALWFSSSSKREVHRRKRPRRRAIFTPSLRQRKRPLLSASGTI